jgi:phospholipase/carboxylesterase
MKPVADPSARARRHPRASLALASFTILLTLGALPLAPGGAAAQDTPFGYFFVEVPTLQPTLLLLPKNFDSSKTYSVILALHGFGDSPESFAESLKSVADAGFVLAAVRPPYSFVVPADSVRAQAVMGFDWTFRYLGQQPVTERATQLSIDYVVTAARTLRQSLKVDKLYVLGFSQGGGIAYRLLGTHPEIADGFVSLGTSLPANWTPAAVSSGAGAPAVTLPKRPVYIGHGLADNPARAAAARDSLVARGYDVTYRTFDVGHLVPPAMLKDILEWIAKRP